MKWALQNCRYSICLQEKVPTLSTGKWIMKKKLYKSSVDKEWVLKPVCYLPMVAANNENSSSAISRGNGEKRVLFNMNMTKGHIVSQELQRRTSDSSQIQVAEQAFTCGLIRLIYASQSLKMYPEWSPAVSTNPIFLSFVTIFCLEQQIFPYLEVDIGRWWEYLHCDQQWAPSSFETRNAAFKPFIFFLIVFLIFWLFLGRLL